MTKKEDTEKNDYDPIHGNVFHIRGENPEADKAWDKMMEKQEKENERIAILLEREHAEKLGVLQDFEKHVAEGRFREFMPQLNYLKLQSQLKLERKIYFCMGLVVGFIIALLIKI